MNRPMSKENGTELTDSRIDSPEEKTAGAAKAGSGTLTGGKKNSMLLIMLILKIIF